LGNVKASKIETLGSRIDEERSQLR